MLKIKNPNSFMPNDKTNVVCYGAGKNLQHFLRQYPNITPMIIDSYKVGEEIMVHNKTITIISLNQFICKQISNFILVITCLDFGEIVELLDGYRELDGIDCYIYVFMKEKPTHYDIKQMKGPQIIPKVIHYCWFGGSSLSDKAQKCIESWKKNCPDFEIKRWDESNYDVMKDVYIKQAYQAKKWAFVSDYARIDILYQYGGVYLDTDVELIRPIDDLLSYALYCGFESDDYVSFGLGVGCVPKHNIMKQLFEEYKNAYFLNKDGTFNLKTCPIFQSEVLQNNGFIMNGKYQEKDGVAIFPREFFSPYYALAGLGEITSHTRSIHWFDSSWETDEYKKRKEIRENNIKKITERMLD